jgi:hypothetical protein
VGRPSDLLQRVSVGLTVAIHTSAMKISPHIWPLLVASVAPVLACRGEESRAKDNASSGTRALSSIVATSAAPALSSPNLSKPASSGSTEEKRPTSPLYVRLPGAIPPLERSDKFESPLDALLRERKLGQVSRGGAGLKPGGGIEYAGLDVDVYDVQAALPVVIQELRELKAPKGTTVEELRDDGPAIPHKVW